MMNKTHSFHIPVLGIGYSADTPVKVAPYGIDSVVSLVDDILLEKLRKMYCERNVLPYEEITNKQSDYRAKRITSYLNLLKYITEVKFEALKDTAFEDSYELRNYFSMLPGGKALEDAFDAFSASETSKEQLREWLDNNLSLGRIDVNIMTKVDRENYKNGEKMPVEYNDAHAALRGFAMSELESSLILSAGINPRLYSYMQEFEDFYPDAAGYIRKKIVLKVSDYKSALIQGKFLAKKGIWVSEYRIESGLNCGGHAFATDGLLMGPILAEFRDKRQVLLQSTYEVLVSALKSKNRVIPDNPLSLKVTAQGGVGTAKEHQFLLDHYQLDSIGWGTPFLLVPEATTVDEATLDQLIEAKEEDLYLSDISPLGIPFNSLRGNTKDLEKLSLIASGKPGSSCSKKYAALSNEFSDKTICTASRHYQTLKLKELSKAGISAEEYREQYNKIVGKSCICVGLGTSCLIANKLDNRIEGNGVSVCPGPNLAYFSSAMSLKDISNHIYGRVNLIRRNDRPNMFVKELHLYVDYLKERISEIKDVDEKLKNKLRSFAENLSEGIDYYMDLFSSPDHLFSGETDKILAQLQEQKSSLSGLILGMHAKYELEPEQQV